MTIANSCAMNYTFAKLIHRHCEDDNSTVAVKCYTVKSVICCGLAALPTQDLSFHTYGRAVGWL